MDFLKAICEFPALENLTLFALCHQAASKRKQLDIDEASVHELFQMLRSLKVGSPLTCLRVEHTEFFRYVPYGRWQVGSQAIYTGHLIADGQSRVRRLDASTPFPDAQLKEKIAKGVELPLRRYSPDDDLIWLAQNLEIEWALVELVAEGLVAKDAIEQPIQHKPSLLTKMVFKMHLDGELDVRVTLKGKLRAHKWRNNYGKCVYLYDVLYPTHRKVR